MARAGIEPATPRFSVRDAQLSNKARNPACRVRSRGFRVERSDPRYAQIAGDCRGFRPRDASRGPFAQRRAVIGLGRLSAAFGEDEVRRGVMAQTCFVANAGVGPAIP
jgi:hypothetical protein